MANVNSPRRALTVQLPGELIDELEAVARYIGVPIDEVVMEACLVYAEPYLWEESFKKWRDEHPVDGPCDFGIDGRDLRPPVREGRS